MKFSSNRLISGFAESLASLIRSRILPLLIWLIYTPLRWSWRVRVIESEDLKKFQASGSNFCFAHWHGDELGMLYLLLRYKCAAVTSTSKDGQIINGFLELMGVPTSRGSSTRGGVGALRGILKNAKLGYRAVLAVDGPKGPYHKVKPGIFEISKLLRAPIIPTGVAAKPAFVFNRSWNKAFLPLPFAKITIAFGQAIAPPSSEQDPKSSELALGLEKALEEQGLIARNDVLS